MINQETINSAPAYFNEEVLNEFRDNNIDCWVAGGSVRDYLIGQEPKDYDIYFPNETEYKKAERFLYENGGQVVFETENGKKYQIGDRHYDLVKIFNNSPEDTISRFDYTICMFAVDGERLIGGDRSMEDLQSGKLKLNFVANADSTLARSYKFTKRGFSMSNAETQKLSRILRKTTEKRYSNFVSGQPEENTPVEDDNQDNQNTGNGNTPTNQPTNQPKKQFDKRIIVGGLLVLGLIYLLKNKNK
jgi:hypothetical protein